MGGGLISPHEANIETDILANDQLHAYPGNFHEGEYVALPSKTLPISSTSGTPGPETPMRFSLPDQISHFRQHELGRSDSNERNVSTATASAAFTYFTENANSTNSLPTANSPAFVHKWSHSHSILCVIAAPSKNVLICGTQDSKILMYDMNDFSLKYELNAGTKDVESSVLCLTLSKDENYLFSAGSDSLVEVWDLSKLNSEKKSSSQSTSPAIRCTHIIYSLIDIGDIFSISWSDCLSTIFIGAQNASISWCQLHFDKQSRSNSVSTDEIDEPTPVALHQPGLEHAQNLERLPRFRYDKFFDSKGPGGSVNNLQTKYQLHKEHVATNRKNRSLKASLEEITKGDIIRFAHNGYVYCLEIFNCKEQADTNEFLNNYKDKYENLLISCGGDGIVNFWGIEDKDSDGEIKLTKITSLDSHDSILSMTIQDSYIYAGLSNSTINVWDLCTLQLIRSFKYCNDEVNARERMSDEILSLGIHNNCIFKASNKGGLSKLTLKLHAQKSPMYEEVRIGTNSAYEGNDHTFSTQKTGPVLALRIFTVESGSTYLLSGCSRALCLWDISKVGQDPSKNDAEVEICSDESHDHNKERATDVASISGMSEFSEGDEIDSSIQRIFPKSKFDNKSLLRCLQRYISYKTISKLPELYVDDSRHCAQFLSKLFISFGAKQTKLLPVDNGNPVVYAMFERNAKNISPDSPRKRLLWYAHYDVVDADGERDDWATDPFVLTAKDGNLYGRGVSDNKGPTLSSIYAVTELYHKNELSCDVVFIIEGEEECGSIGFQKVVNNNKKLIGDIDWIMLSNSYWLDDEIPCLNYGLRGVINASILVISEKPDRHSGVDGGVLKEPTMDLIQILGKLVDPVTNKILIPNFYDDVLPTTEREIEIYEKIGIAAERTGMDDQDVKTLLAKWRNPSLTVHKLEVSGPNNNTVIPQVAQASISIRVVPNQDLTSIKSLLIEYLNKQFGAMGNNRENKLKINVFHEAEPWLGDPSNMVYLVLYDNLVKNWGSQTPEPLFIREGGSIPSIRFLEKCFDAQAAQIPCGQASDHAHLQNEKLRVLNLFKLRSVLVDTFRELGHK